MKKKVIACGVQKKNAPGFTKRYFALPLSEQMNESIARDLRGGDTEICYKALPDYVEKQGVYRIPKLLVDKILASRNRKECKLYCQHREGGALVPYRSSEQVAKQKDEKAKRKLNPSFGKFKRKSMPA